MHKKPILIQMATCPNYCKLRSITWAEHSMSVWEKFVSRNSLPNVEKEILKRKKKQ